MKSLWNVRPHPGPLPQEREKTSQVFSAVIARGSTTPFRKNEQAATTANRATEFSSNTDSPSLSPGERAGVRAGVNSLLTFAFFVVVLFALQFVSASAAENPATEFDAANKLFAQNKFADAAAAYEKLTQAGSVSPALYFNLGNAYFKSGQIGRAIAAYRQAENLAPRDPDVRANLHFARNQVQGPTVHAGLIERSLATLNLNEWAGLGALALWLTFALLAAKQLKPQLAGPLKTWTLLSVVATVGLGALLTGVAQFKLGNQTVVITAHDASVRTSPFDESPNAFTANDGAELRVLDRKDSWLQVSDGGRRTGWVRRDAVAAVSLREHPAD
ncbi:MAG: tetratricopeptide repeat protein [Verrucomicrobia bacterium]|nr:MAG: tetratricopeptide repeat protein [Verrucomicrobiota bacterium]